jgi:hypothetical protein
MQSLKALYICFSAKEAESNINFDFSFNHLAKLEILSVLVPLEEISRMQKLLSGMLSVTFLDVARLKSLKRMI